MKKLLSLPPNVVSCFHSLRSASREEWFCACDPPERKLGSGGGTAWLLKRCRESENTTLSLASWLEKERRVLLHAGGQSRRLPAYAAEGKALTPLPVFRWERGQTLTQTLLDLQLPLFERILAAAPKKLRLLVASGDVYILPGDKLPTIPEADVVCLGLWAGVETAQGHGVFAMKRETPEKLDFMLQKPAPQTLAALTGTHFYLMDAGIWLLSTRAVEKLCQKSIRPDGGMAYYDLYGTYGCALGEHPSKEDTDLSELTVAVLPLDGGAFYHYGTSRDLLSSTTALQNLVQDQRHIFLHKTKPQPSIFTQNARITNRFTPENHDIWVENACVPDSWTLTTRNIVTGIPENNWQLRLDDGQCLDVLPIGDEDYALRPYGFDDPFRGTLQEKNALFLGQSLREWLCAHKLDESCFPATDDMQRLALFPVSKDLALLGDLARWMLDPAPAKNLAQGYLSMPRLSADSLMERTNLRRREQQRRTLRAQVLPRMAEGWKKSVFYQLNLKHTAALFAREGLAMPPALPPEAPRLIKARDAMFRSEYERNKGRNGKDSSLTAFRLMREGLLSATTLKETPRRNVMDDQIVWGRSPVRIDLAGGWTDTPPYTLFSGGNVVNMAITLNGAQPLQVYIKPSKEPVVTCRSIDLGVMERIENWQELSTFNQVGSPFSIPKAALALAGFLPEFCATHYTSLRQQLEQMGGGMEITLLSAIPAGSGLGTSSILAATVLASLSDFCELSWDKTDVCLRTLLLEQLLTTGGGWQDQYGGVLSGIKLLQSESGMTQKPLVRWLPENLFQNEDYRPCHLLYYTGLTRTAKHILSEIVRGMFLSDTRQLALLREMKEHALHMQRSIQCGDFQEYGHLVRRSWQQNKQLDPGTSPEPIEELTRRIDDLCLGYKLPGAGGGGYLYMVAKDVEAAQRLRALLTDHPLSANARFVEMKLSEEGLKVTRS